MIDDIGICHSFVLVRGVGHEKSPALRRERLVG